MRLFTERWPYDPAAAKPGWSECVQVIRTDWRQPSPSRRKEFTLKISSNNSEGVYSMVRFPQGLWQNLQRASSYFQRAEQRPSESMRKTEERRREKAKQRTPKQPAEF